MAFKVFEAQIQPAIQCLAQAVHQLQIAVASQSLTRLDPLDSVAANSLANLRCRPAAHGGRGQFTLGGTFTALSRQFLGQTQRQENVLLRPAALGQVVDDT
ncbi:hypothetical protein D3C84_1033890 [compost metagenome]